MKFTAILLVLVCLCPAAYCQSISLDTDRIATLIGEWNFAHNARSNASFEAVYDDTLLFYTETLLQAQAIALKQRLFKQNPSFEQRIRSEITYTPFTSGVTKCDFTKEVLEEREWKAYPSYLLVSYEGNAYVIVGESDHATDKTLRYRLEIGSPMTFENTSAQPGVFGGDSPLTVASDSFLSSIRNNINLRALDSIMYAVDPLKMFPELSSMGMVTVPKGYVFALIAFLSFGGIMIFVADMIRSRKRRRPLVVKKSDKADRVIRDFKMQSVFEAFAITLFDPLYFRHRRPRPERVLAGSVSEGETGHDLEFEFHYKETHARFAIKCLYFRNGAKNEVHLFPAQGRESFKGFEEEHETPLYFVLGFGGSPDDPRELFLLPAKDWPSGVVKKEALKAYSKSGMFFYNRVAAKLQ